MKFLRRWDRCLYPTKPDVANLPRTLCNLPLERWPDASLRCEHGHFNTEERLLSEAAGRLVREVWVAWACDQQNPKGHHLTPWEMLSFKDQEVDCRIGETLIGVRDWRINQTGRRPKDIEYVREQFKKHIQEELKKEPVRYNQLIATVPMVVILDRCFLNVPTEGDPLPVHPGMPIEIRCMEKDAAKLANQLRQWADLIDPPKDEP